MKRFFQLCFAMKWRYWFWLLLLISHPVVASGVDGETRHVLLLHSYHSTLDWTSTLSDAARKELTSSGFPVELHEEFMDTKRLYTPDYLEKVRSIFALKYQTKKIDIIIVSDNNAFDFIRKNRDSLFPGVPVVFCGVNNFSDNWLDGLSDFTGVAEMFDAHATVSTLSRLHPNIKEIFVLHDQTPTGLAWAETVRQQVKPLTGTLRFRYSDPFTLETLVEKIKGLSQDTAVLMTVYFRDDVGQYHSPDRLMRQLAQISTVPIYAMLDFFLRNGAVGGNMIGGASQGEAAAVLALRVLRGEKAGDIPVVKSGVNRWQFDHNQLARFQISEKLLPHGSEVINTPSSLYHDYQKEFWSALVVVFLLTILSIALAANVIRRRRIERALTQYQEALETRVEERTEHLSKEINNRLDAEADLKQSQEALRIIINNIQDAVFIYQFNGEIVDINHKMLKMYDLEEDDVIGKSLLDFFVTNQENAHYEQIWARVEQGEKISFVWQALAPNRKQVFDVEVVLRQVELFDMPLILANVRDITHQLEYERRISESENHFRTLVESTKAVPWRLELATGRFTYMGSQIESVLGYPAESWKTIHDWKDRLHPDDVEQAFEYCLTRSNRLENHEFQYRALTADNRIVWIRDVVTVISEAGKATELLGFMFDIDDLKSIQRDLEEKSHLAGVANQAKSDFLATMSHEIRTPMNTVIGMGEALLDTDITQEQRNFIQIQQHAGEALLDLINAILDLSKIEAGHFELNHEPFNLYRMIEETCHVMNVQASRKSLGYEYAIDKQLPQWIEGDSARLRQILINLIGNAIKFTETGKISIKVQHSKDDTDQNSIYFLIADTGIGISSSQVSKIFDKFSQGDPSVVRSFGGTGLGLSITQHLVNMMHGRIWVESEINAGSSFIFTIPYVAVEPEVVETGDTPHPVSIVASDREEVRILLVEDAPDNRMLIETYLKRTDYHLDTAEDGEQGVQKALATPYDLILMDVQMPVVDGYSATRRIRAWEKSHGRAAVPIVALTAHALASDREKSLQAGCTDHVTKPVKKAVLMDTIRQYIERAPLSKGIRHG
ncbi:MAG: PAS domain S-box protein [Magnetococcales bacterium]|nr:PAS domain S-box protein [Magnetococcales bacterium]